MAKRSMFGARHYRFVARIIVRIRPRVMRVMIANAFAKAFRDENPEFKPKHWFQACDTMREG